MQAEGGRGKGWLAFNRKLPNRDPGSDSASPREGDVS